MPGKAILKDEELALLVQSVGFSSTRTHRGVREDAVAVAIILAESGGNANAHNDNSATRDNSYGLFQINLYGNLRDERVKRYNLRSNSNLFQPKRNAEIAFDLFQRAGNRFTDWSTYNNGAYLRHLPRAVKAVGNPASKLPTLEGQLESLDPLAGLTDALNFITSGENWIRVALFVGGGLVILLAVILFANETGNAPVPVARVARVARKVRG